MSKIRPQNTAPALEGGGGFAPGKTAGEIESQAADAVRHGAAAGSLSPEERHLRISLAAYRRAEARGFAPGAEREDWLAAEREVDAEIQG